MASSSCERRRREGRWGWIEWLRKRFSTKLRFCNRFRRFVIEIIDKAPIVIEIFGIESNLVERMPLENIFRLVTNALIVIEMEQNFGFVIVLKELKSKFHEIVRK